MLARMASPDLHPSSLPLFLLLLLFAPSFLCQAQPLSCPNATNPLVSFAIDTSTPEKISQCFNNSIIKYYDQADSLDDCRKQADDLACKSGINGSAFVVYSPYNFTKDNVLYHDANCLSGVACADGGIPFVDISSSSTTSYANVTAAYVTCKSCRQGTQWPFQCPCDTATAICVVKKYCGVQPRYGCNCRRSAYTPVPSSNGVVTKCKAKPTKKKTKGRKKKGRMSK